MRPDTSTRGFAALLFATASLLAQAPVPVEPSPAATPIPESSSYETFGGADDADEGAEIPFDATAEEVPAADRSANVAQSYEIVRGDTLWDICKKILGDPWYWPKLWSLNEYISNPHLIYPGNVIKFYPGSEVAPPSLVIEGTGSAADAAPVAAAPAGEPPVRDPEISIERSVANPSAKGGALRLRPLAFVARKKLEPLGKISYSSTPRVELVLSDTVYLEFAKKTKVAVGDKFHVIEFVQEVFDPEKTMHSYGWMTRKNAVLQVVQITGETVEAKIISGDRSVRRGDVFVAYSPEVREITPFDGKKLISGKIVATENQKILLSQNEFGFLSVGKSQGVQEGMRFYVVKRGDGVFPGDADAKLPYVVIGYGVIAEVFEQTSTIYISNLKETLEVGMPVRNSANP